MNTARVISLLAIVAAMAISAPRDAAAQTLPGAPVVAAQIPLCGLGAGGFSAATLATQLGGALPGGGALAQNMLVPPPPVFTPPPVFAPPPVLVPAPRVMTADFPPPPPPPPPPPCAVTGTCGGASIPPCVISGTCGASPLCTDEYICRGGVCRTERVCEGRERRKGSAGW